VARELKCNYRMCDNMGVAVNPIKYNGKYYCADCLKKMQYEAEMRRKIMDAVLEILPKEIPSLINKVVSQWIALDYQLEYILYTIKYIQLNKYILNHVHGIRYYMNKDDIANAYKSAKIKHELRKIEKEGFEISKDEEEFSYNSNDNYLNISW